MAFMECEIYPKGALYACDCQNCGSTTYWHEWVSEGSSDELHAERCAECFKQLSNDPKDVTYCGRQYAGRYSAPGYLDCTEWQYSPNKKTLKQELDSIYGEDER